MDFFSSPNTLDNNKFLFLLEKTKNRIFGDALSHRCNGKKKEIQRQQRNHVHF
jgi:hypothetical protein